MPKNRVGLKVNGLEYSGWKRVTIVRGIKALSGAFDLNVSDKWAPTQSWAIKEEDRCELTIDDEPVITGWVDHRNMESDEQAHTLDLGGRDAAGALVDCSAMLGKWEFRGIALFDLAKKLVAPFSIPVTIQSGLDLKAPEKFSIDPGDTPFEVLDRYCRLAGVLPISDGRGGINILRPGADFAVSSLVYGENVKKIRVATNAEERFSRYVVHGQHPSSDGYSGETAAIVKGEAIDETVRRSHRVLLIRPEGGVTRATAKARAEWEATVRQGRSISVTVLVQGWRQEDGSLWPINATVPVKSKPHNIDGEMLITQAVFSIDDQGGTLTELSLEDPGAYRPEPKITVKAKELWFPK